MCVDRNSFLGLNDSIKQNVTTVLWRSERNVKWLLASSIALISSFDLNLVSMKPSVGRRLLSLLFEGSPGSIGDGDKAHSKSSASAHGIVFCNYRNHDVILAWSCFQEHDHWDRDERLRMPGHVWVLSWSSRSRTENLVALLAYQCVCGSMRTVTPGRCRCSPTRIDGFTRYAVVYLLKRNNYELRGASMCQGIRSNDKDRILQTAEGHTFRPGWWISKRRAGCVLSSRKDLPIVHLCIYL